MCDCKCCISAKSIHSSLISWRQEKENRIYKTYKNTVMPHGCHIYAKAYDIAKATMCANSQSDNLLKYWKFVV